MNKFEMNKFSELRGKARIGPKCSQMIAHKLAKTDAKQEVSAGRNPIYVIAGPFACNEHTRVGQFRRGRMYWKFVHQSI